MKNSALNILVVDDHPMNSDAYINLIKTNQKENASTFHKAIDCFTAHKIIKLAEKSKAALDVALIDINIPECPEEKLYSGTDCIIIMLTMHTEPLVLYNTYKSINPEGFLSKNDIDFEMFPEIINKIVHVENYYSTSINKAIQQLVKQTFGWDEFDSQIVLLLEKGIHTKDMPNYMNLSLSSIEKRKAIIKRQILEKKSSDKELIAECKKLKLV
jgi:DNA-binding NarL/FixJ family response regulator